MLAALSNIRKAVVATITSAGPLLIAAVQDSSPGGSSVTTAEVVAVAVTGVVGFAAVWAVPNTQVAQ
jgi:hypothetical protein